MAKQQSLAAKTGTLPEFKLPALFEQPAQSLATKRWPPYFTFVHPRKADEWAKCSRVVAELKEGMMFFVDGNNIVHLPNPKVAFLGCSQHWVHRKTDGTGEVIAATVHEMPNPFKEEVEAVICVYFEDRIVPCNALFRSAKVPAVKALNDALKDAAEPAWAQLSPAHAETLVAQKPYMRFYGVLSLAAPKTGKESGMPYTVCNAHIHPTTLVEWRLLAAAFESDTFAQQLNEVTDNYQKRLAAVTSKVK